MEPFDFVLKIHEPFSRYYGPARFPTCESQAQFLLSGVVAEKEPRNFGKSEHEPGCELDKRLEQLSLPDINELFTSNIIIIIFITKSMM